MTIDAWNDYVTQVKMILGDAPRNPEIAQCISCQREADCVKAQFDSGSALGSPNWWCRVCFNKFSGYLIPAMEGK